LQSISTKQPFYIKSDSKNNLSLQDDEGEEYSSDFDKESSEEEKDGEEAKYFKDFGSNQAFRSNGSQSKIQVLSVVK
jgi:nucleosome binding factor SPN SPT16 subunit